MWILAPYGFLHRARCYHKVGVGVLLFGKLLQYLACLCGLYLEQNWQ